MSEILLYIRLQLRSFSTKVAFSSLGERLQAHAAGSCIELQERQPDISPRISKQSLRTRPQLAYASEIEQDSFIYTAIYAYLTHH